MRKNEDMEILDNKVTILAERGEEILLKIENKMKFGNSIFTTLRHEWWVNRDKMEKGIAGEGNNIYCRGFAGSTDEEVIKVFNNGM